METDTYYIEGEEANVLSQLDQLKTQRRTYIIETEA